MMKAEAKFTVEAIGTFEIGHLGVPFLQKVVLKFY